MTSMNWRLRGACRDEDPELFFPVGTGEVAAEQARQAKEVCSGCPVSSQCLSWALETGQDFGIWGGVTEQERRARRRADIVNATAQPQSKSVTQQGKRAELDLSDVELVLNQLDNGAYFTEVAAVTGIGREVCQRLWRENRAAPTPPGRRTRNNRKSSVLNAA